MIRLGPQWQNSKNTGANTVNAVPGCKYNKVTILYMVSWPRVLKYIGSAIVCPEPS